MAEDSGTLLTRLADQIEQERLMGFSCFFGRDGWRVTPRSQTGWRQHVDAPTLAAALEQAFFPVAPRAEPEGVDYNRSVVIHEDDDDDDGMDLV